MSFARILLHAMFVLVGVGTTMYGPLLPELSARWGMGDGGAGVLLGTVFVCAVGGALSVTVLLRRFAGWDLMVMGFVCAAIGAMGLSSSVWLPGFAGSCLLGFGLGIVNPTANLAAAAMWPERTGSALTLLNLFFSAGAVVAPPCIGYCIEVGWTAQFPAVYGALTLAGAAMAVRWRFRPNQKGSASAPAELLQPATEAAPVHDLAFAGASMWLLFLYVGVEVSLGGWSTTYLLRATEASAMQAASTPSAFWGAILLSRLLAVGILPRVGMLALLVAGSALSLVGSFWLLVPENPLLILIAVALAGAGLGPIFPNTVGYFLEHGGPRAIHLTGVVFASGSVGGAVLPMLIGQVSERTGSLYVAMWLIPLGAALMLAAVGLAAWTRPPIRQTGARGPGAI